MGSGMGELTLYQKIYDLILYALPIINRFPRSQRFVLGQQLQNGMIEISAMIVQAQKIKNKLPTLYETDIKLEELRLLVRLAKDLKFMPINKYENHCKKIDEIGRLLGGWIKQSQIQGRNC